MTVAPPRVYFRTNRSLRQNQRFLRELCLARLAFSISDESDVSIRRRHRRAGSISAWVAILSSRRLAVIAKCVPQPFVCSVGGRRISRLIDAARVVVVALVRRTSVVV